MITPSMSTLPAEIRRAIDEDLDLIARLAPERLLPLQGRHLQLVSLSDGKPPADIPDHQLIRPATTIPSPFDQRCKWEIERQSFQIIDRGDTLWVIGGAAPGCYYGMLELLEALTGVIWAGLTEADIWFGPTLPLPTAVQRPTLAFRSRDGAAPNGDLSHDFLRWLSRNRYNNWRRNSQHWVRLPVQVREPLLRLCRERSIHLTLGDHAMAYFLPEEIYSQRPDWFGMREGKRLRRGHVTMPDVPHLNCELPIQPCFSNPDLREYLAGRMAAHMAEHPQADIFGLWPHDGVNNWCECENCLRSTPYEHMHALAMVLSEKLPPHLPIELISYSNLLNLPWKPLPRNDRIFTMLCPYLRPFRHRIFEPWDHPLETGTKYPAPDRINPVDDREYGILFERWKQTCDAAGQAIAIFEYGPPFPDETRRFDRTRYHYHPCLELRADEIRWYSRRGVSLYYLCNVHNGWPDSFHQLMHGRLMWNPDALIDQWAARYYTAMAGEKGLPLRKALCRIDEVLLREESPLLELAVLAELLDGTLNAPWAERYRLWIRYVHIARAAREAELAADYETAIRYEQRIQALLDDIAPAIENYIPPDYLRRNSILFEQRHKEKLGASQSCAYHL